MVEAGVSSERIMAESQIFQIVKGIHTLTVASDAASLGF